MDTFGIARLIAAKAAIAHACLDALPPAQLGDVRLRDDQQLAIARARRLIARAGGALVAEDVGRGKTFIALSVASAYRSPVVVAPAALRATWRHAAQRAAVAIEFVSMESLSRGRTPSQSCDCVVVDEAHHFRNPASRRYATFADWALYAHVLLLSATPLQNRVADLGAQLALFLGEAAVGMQLETMSAFVVRGISSVSELPRVSAPRWIGAGVDESRVLDAILDLPPPARPLDGGDAGILRTIQLVRAWSSSRAALVATLGYRRRVATALEQGIESGRLPTKRESSAWSGTDGAVQLGFASLMIAHTASTGEVAAVRESLEREHAALDRLRQTMRDCADPDLARAGVLRGLRAQFPSSRIVVFSEFATTVERLFAILVHDGGIGLSTADECRIASGRLDRDELLALFAPRAQGRSAAAKHEAVTMLLTTDLLSEGINLQDASVVVHMDLPWNPARLAQRVGRVRRPGGAPEIHSFLFTPPAAADLLLHTDALLRRKLAQTSLAIGRSFDVLPRLWEQPGRDRADSPLGHAEQAGTIVDALRPWRAASGVIESPPGVFAVVDTGAFAWIAALSDGTLLSSAGRSAADIAQILDVLGRARPASKLLDGAALCVAEEEIRAHLAAHEVRELCGMPGADGPVRREIRKRIDAMVTSAPRHRRASLLRSVATLRRHLDEPLPAGLERRLLAILCATDDPGDALACLRARPSRVAIPLTIAGAIVGMPTA